MFTSPNVFDEQAEQLEAALWTAVRTFKEKAVLARQLARSEAERGEERNADRFEEEAKLADRYGELITTYLLRQQGEAKRAS